jgi:hypothetical protein
MRALERLSWPQDASFKLAFAVFVALFFASAFFLARAADERTSSSSLFLDSDQDNLTDSEEALYGTDPKKKDTDGDSYSDGVEVESGFDPLRPAPGDRIAPVVEAKPQANAAPADNLTAKTSDEIASVLKNAGDTGELTVDDVNEAVQKVLADNSDVTLPEIDTKEIKIKKAPSKSLSEEKRKAEEKEDVTEYLTVIAYLFANNAPKPFTSEDELSSMLSSLAEQSALSLSSGNASYLDALAEKGKNIEEGAREVEVPESMLSVHVKALQLAAYAQTLKDELRPSDTDPLGQIAVLAKVQGFLNVVSSFTDEVHAKMGDYGIDEIPIDL